MRAHTVKTIRRGALAGALAAFATAAGLVSGVAGASPVVPGRPLSCAALGGSGPGYNAAIGNAQNGKKVCITEGEKLLVFLSVPATDASKWQGIRVSPAGLLTVAPLTLMLPRGVTAQNFRATHLGTAHLSSQRMACSPPPGSQVACGALVAWKATVVVLAPAAKTEY